MAKLSSSKQFFVVRASLDAILFALFYNFLHFCGSTRGFRGSSLGQKWPFYLVLPHSWDLPFCIKLIELSMPYFCWLAESGGTWLKNQNCKVLFSKKIYKMRYFQIPSFKLKNKFEGSIYNQLVPPIPLPWPQVSKPNHSRFWPVAVCTI